MSEKTSTELEFVRNDPGGQHRCTVEICEDKSVYVDGDEIEMIFEFSPDNLSNAIAHLEKLGYARNDVGQSFRCKSGDSGFE